MSACGSSARLIIICGLPGSGKTTLAKALESRHHAIRFAPDDWMEALSLNLWDEVKRARIELHYLDAPGDVLFERIQLRGLENPSSRRLPTR